AGAGPSSAPQATETSGTQTSPNFVEAGPSTAPQAMDTSASQTTPTMTASTSSTKTKKRSADDEPGTSRQNKLARTDDNSP
ncbi:hypothetical protein JTE90_014132, partial [Oedothorax gibbosus]